MAVQSVPVSPVIDRLLHLLGLMTVCRITLQIGNDVGQVFVHPCLAFGHSLILAFSSWVRELPESLGAFVDMTDVIPRQLLDLLGVFGDRLSAAFDIDQFYVNLARIHVGA